MLEPRGAGGEAGETACRKQAIRSVATQELSHSANAPAGKHQASARARACASSSEGMWPIHTAYDAGRRGVKSRERPVRRSSAPKQSLASLTPNRYCFRVGGVGWSGRGWRVHPPPRYTPFPAPPPPHTHPSPHAHTWKKASWLSKVWGVVGRDERQHRDGVREATKRQMGAAGSGGQERGGLPSATAPPTGTGAPSRWYKRAPPCRPATVWMQRA